MRPIYVALIAAAILLFVFSRKAKAQTRKLEPGLYLPPQALFAARGAQPFVMPTKEEARRSAASSARSVKEILASYGLTKASGQKFAKLAKEKKQALYAEVLAHMETLKQPGWGVDMTVQELAEWRGTQATLDNLKSELGIGVAGLFASIPGLNKATATMRSAGHYISDLVD
jgi:hypothetical protein